MPKVVHLGTAKTKSQRSLVTLATNQVRHWLKTKKLFNINAELELIYHLFTVENINLLMKEKNMYYINIISFSSLLTPKNTQLTICQ